MFHVGLSNMSAERIDGLWKIILYAPEHLMLSSLSLYSLAELNMSYIYHDALHCLLNVHQRAHTIQCVTLYAIINCSAPDFLNNLNIVQLHFVWKTTRYFSKRGMTSL